MKKGIRILALAACLCGLLAMGAAAVEAPYSGYTYNYYGKSVPAPLAYVPGDTLYGEDLGVEGGLRDARDLLVSGESIYIADTGHNRVLQLDKNYRLVRTITEVTSPTGKVTALSEPSGVFVKDGLVYIADTKNNRIIAVDESNCIVRTLKKPNSTLIPKGVDFLPTRVLVDYGDNVYVICSGYYQGFVAYNAADEFTGFYGGNEVQLSVSMLSMQFWKSIFSKEQRESLQRAVPVEYSGAHIVGDFIYTCSKMTQNSTGEIQKLNPLGVNILTPTSSVGYDNTNFGDIETVTYRQSTTDNNFVDIHVDENDIIAVLDQERGRAFLYDQECNFLGTFGVMGSQKGTMKTPSAIDKMGDTYLVLDAAKNCVHTFHKSEYMVQIEQGLRYYSQGLYAESVEPWRNALQYNSQCMLAYISIGKAYMQENDYQTAMEYYRKGQDRAGYSRALREYRKQVMSRYFLVFVLGAVAVVLLLKVILGRLLRALGVKRVKRSISFN